MVDTIKTLLDISFNVPHSPWKPGPYVLNTTMLWTIRPKSMGLLTADQKLRQGAFGEIWCRRRITSCTIRSWNSGIPRGRWPPFGLGIYTATPHWKRPSRTESCRNFRVLRDVPSMVRNNANRYAFGSHWVLTSHRRPGRYTCPLPRARDAYL